MEITRVDADRQVKLVLVMKWLARVASGLLIAFFLFMIAGHILGDAEAGSNPLTRRDWTLFVAMGLELSGLALAWKWELIGAGVTLAGYALFQVVEGVMFSGPYFSAFLVIAVMFMVVGILKKS